MLCELNYLRTTRIWVAGCWAHFAKNAVQVSANDGHYYAVVFGIFSFCFSYFVYKSLHENIKSCNLNPEFCGMNRESNSGAQYLRRYLRQFQAVVAHTYALLVGIRSSRSEILYVLYFWKFSTASGGLYFSKVS
jgi:hypothetical protein